MRLALRMWHPRPHQMQLPPFQQFPLHFLARFQPNRRRPRQWKIHIQPRLFFGLAPQSVISDGVLLYAFELRVDHRLHFSGPPLVGFGSRLQVGKRPTLFQVAAGFETIIAVSVKNETTPPGVNSWILPVPFNTSRLPVLSKVKPTGWFKPVF